MNDKISINFVVTDLDDTLWDWLHMWYSSFSPFLNRISDELKIDLDILKKSFKSLHQKYHTSEASPFLEDLPGLTKEQIDYIRETSDDMKGILHQYNSDKKNNLFLYQGVFETLTTLKQQGSKIIGYTESNSFFTKYRIKHLNLDGILDRIYAPEDTGVPIDMKKFYPDDYWEPKVTEFKYLPQKFMKPNAEILETIFDDFKANKSKGIYIGDKLDRDIYMAQQANILSVYAKYGHNIDSNAYNLLREVTHWTDDDVQREIKFKANFHANPKPNFVLYTSYKELLDHFEFIPFKHDI